MNQNLSMKVGMKRSLIFLSVFIFACSSIFAQVDQLENFADKRNERIIEIAKMLHETPQGFGSIYKNRAIWTALAKNIKYSEIIAEAEKYSSLEIPKWDDALYLEFSKTGYRPSGEKMINDRFRPLSPLVWAECLENKGRFVAAIEGLLEAYLAQPSWVSPAHDRSLNDFYQKRYSVDLRAATFAQTLAQTVYMLDDKLNQSLKKRVMDALNLRVFYPVKNALITKQFDAVPWLIKTNNWNSVCLSGITGAALAVIQSKEERALFVAAAEYYSQNSMAGYKDDGYCTEGVGYYSYGFGHYICLREQILQQTNAKLNLFDRPKIANIAAFGSNIEIINKQYPAFGDCRMGSKPSDVISWYYSNSTVSELSKLADYNERISNDSSLFSNHSAQNFFELENRMPDELNTNAIFFFPNTATIVSGKSSNAEKMTNKIRTYFENSGVLICRPFETEYNNSLAVVFKGGNNAEHHNHNDLGSYVIVKGQETLAGEQGGPHHYAGDMGTSKRYVFKSLSSYGHPVPLINGVEQSPGKDAQAVVLNANFAKNKDSWEIDISSAYRANNLKKIVRRFEYRREQNGITIIEDQFEFLKPALFETAITTNCLWEVLENGLIKIKGKENEVFVRITTPKGIKYTLTSEKIEVNAPPYTRIGIRLNNPIAKGTVRVEYLTEY